MRERFDEVSAAVSVSIKYGGVWDLFRWRIRSFRYRACASFSGVEPFSLAFLLSCDTLFWHLKSLEAGKPNPAGLEFFVSCERDEARYVFVRAC
jgi:hypothetical protein